MRLSKLLVEFAVLAGAVVAQSCGSQANGALCDKGCCSQYGYCGTTAEFCLTSQRCQSQCINDGPPPHPAGPKAPNIDTSKLFRPPASTFAHKELVGYFSNWAQYRGEDPVAPACKPDDIFLPEHINPFLYTHLNYAFVFMANNNSVIPHEYDDLDLSMRFNKWVKGLNPSVTTSFSVGGWSMNDGPTKYTGGIDYSTFFSQMASTFASRATFIQSCISFARDLGFDGIDIDWEYVGDPERGGSSADTENFTLLVSDMRRAVTREAASSGRPPLLITVAAPADPDKFALIQGKAVSDYIDWYNPMTYDFYGNWENKVECQAPIADTLQKGWSFTSAIDLYLNSGVPPSKINAGIPLYGRVWTLDDPSCTSPGCTGTGGISGRCTFESGYLGYFEIAEIRDALGSQNMASDAVSFVSQDGYYMAFDNQWVGYDDEYSFQAKVDIINSRGLRGGMLWAVDLDTKDNALTRSLLSYYLACPKDGSWPVTTGSSIAEQLCGPGADYPQEMQTRTCNADLTWGPVDSTACRLMRPDPDDPNAMIDDQNLAGKAFAVKDTDRQRTISNAIPPSSATSTYGALLASSTTQISGHYRSTAAAATISTAATSALTLSGTGTPSELGPVTFTATPSSATATLSTSPLCDLSSISPPNNPLYTSFLLRVKSGLNIFVYALHYIVLSA